jgi:hypothetical protein
MPTPAVPDRRPKNLVVYIRYSPIPLIESGFMPLCTIIPVVPVSVLEGIKGIVKLECDSIDLGCRQGGLFLQPRIFFNFDLRCR